MWEYYFTAEHLKICELNEIKLTLKITPYEKRYDKGCTIVNNNNYYDNHNIFIQFK